MPTYYRSDQARIFVAFPANPEIKLDSISWDVMQGGDTNAQSVNYLPGNMQPAVSMGGPVKRQPMTVERVWSDTLIAAFKAMDNATGRAPVNITYAVNDAKGNAVPSSSIAYTGVLDSVLRPDYDSNSGGTEARLKITVDLNRAIS